MEANIASFFSFDILHQSVTGFAKLGEEATCFERNDYKLWSRK